MGSQTFWIAMQAVATVAAFVAIVFQVRKAQAQIEVIRATTGYDILLRFDERFDSERIRERRKGADEVLREALRLLGERAREEFWNVKGEKMAEALGEFELLGLLIRKKVVDPEGVWSLYSFDVTNYYGYCAKTGYLKYCQRKDPFLYEEFIGLYRKMQEIYREKVGAEEKIDPQFLQE